VAKKQGPWRAARLRAAEKVALDSTATTCHDPADRVGVRRTEREAAEFIADHARELAQVARAAGLDVLGQMLDRAADEAQSVVDAHGNGGGPRQRPQ
jgi:hypothetical protein